ncbi:hypothetical protein EST38_g207 [Candolleomyces aberdarensis]|uniref:F-box domain-containing protein n=1 Tax=Candolleomyces aberdarensis TaxID=2316362 RepID=A0A4Q2E157_9AGAR|nr:hypothetical protein EST38_g207 [Candolleomyces aberdarensis]
MKERLKAKLSRIFGIQGEPATTDSLPRPNSSKEPSPIEVLPNELLTSIFLFNAERTPTSFSDVLTISHVCSYWRTIALDCPELWRQYAFLHNQYGSRGEDFSNALLKRCGDLTLDVGWERISNKYIASVFKTKQHLTLELECDNIHRFRSYSALVTPYHVEKMTAFLKNAQPIQTIEELTLDTGDRFLRRDFPHEIFSKDIPFLRTVTLRSCWLDLSWMRMDNLQTLSVTVAPHALPWPANAWISFLKGCPSLTQFHLSMPAPFTADSESVLPDSDAPKDVVLPSLTRLELHTPFFRICHFLIRLSLPAVQEIHLSMDMYTSSSEGPGIQHIVKQLIIPSLSSDGNRLSVCMLGGTNLAAIGFSPLQDYASGDGYRSDFLSLVVASPEGRHRLAGATQYLPDIWTELTAVAPSITSLCASMCPEDSGYREFEAFLSQATSLNTLFNPGFAMLAGLAKSGAPPLMALEKVVCSPHCSVHTNLRFKDLTIISSLRVFVLERRERGHPIKPVEIHFEKWQEAWLSSEMRGLIENDGIGEVVFD